MKRFTLRQLMLAVTAFCVLLGSVMYASRHLGVDVYWEPDTDSYAVPGLTIAAMWDGFILFGLHGMPMNYNDGVPAKKWIWTYELWQAEPSLYPVEPVPEST